MNSRFFLIILLTGLFMCKSSDETVKGYSYPSLKAEVASDVYFGKKIIDPYRALENLQDTIVLKWFNEQKRIYGNALQQIPKRDLLTKEIEQLNLQANTRSGVPRTAGEKVFYHRIYVKEGEQKLFYRDGLKGKEIELFNTADHQGKNLNIDYYEPSFSGKYLIFGLSSAGNEMATLHVLDVKKKELLPDTLERAMYGNPQWLADESGFFYGQMKEIKTEEDEKTMYEDSKVKLHLLGTKVTEVKEVFSSELNKDLAVKNIDFPFLYTFPESDKVLVAVYHGSQNYATIYHTPLKDLLSKNAKEIKWTNVSTYEDKVEGYALSGDSLFLLNYKDNPNGNLNLHSLTKPEQKQLLLQGEGEVLQGIIQTRNSLFVKALESGISRLIRVDLANLNQQEIQLPFEGALDLRTGWLLYLHSNNMYIGLESWNREFGVYYYDVAKDELIKTDIRPEGKFSNLLDVVVEEVEVPSHDGEMVPLSIIYKKDVQLDGQNPTLLYGYGAYGTSILPSFDLSRLAWLNKGGIYAIAHVRGGGEKGERWYRGGFKETKQNSWKDFIACAEFLIDKKYTSAERLAAEGVSAGGITVGRAITERPDLFKAGVISVGVLNSTRFENTSNTLNIAEFGTVKDSAEFEYLYEMDVYHHIKEGVNYPAMILTAAMNDVRVEPWQPAKVVAKMQEVSGGKNPVLFHIDDGGHFSGNSSSDYQELADQYAFLLWQLGHPEYQLVR